MKIPHLLFTFILVLLSFNAAAQYFPKYGIYVLQWGEAAHGLQYKGTIDFPNNYNNDNLDSIMAHLVHDMYKYNANALRIIHRTYTDAKFNKRFTKIKKRYITYNFEAEIFYAHDVENIRPITYQQYNDSLRNVLISDTTKEALIVFFASPEIADVDTFPVATLRYPGLTPCEIDRYSVCSVIVTEEIPMHFNVGYKRPFTIPVKLGQVYFLEYIPTPLGPVKPADFLTGYRICSELQKINAEINLLRE